MSTEEPGDESETSEVETDPDKKVNLIRSYQFRYDPNFYEPVPDGHTWINGRTHPIEGIRRLLQHAVMIRDWHTVREVDAILDCHSRHENPEDMPAFVDNERRRPKQSWWEFMNPEYSE